MDKRYQLVWDFWTFKGGTPCLICWGPAVTLHEIIPRSRYPGWEEDLLNSVPVCAVCHEEVQADTLYWEPLLQEKAKLRVEIIKAWKGMNDEDFRNLGSALQA